MRSPIVPQSLDFGLSNSWMFRTIPMDDSTLSAYWGEREAMSRLAGRISDKSEGVRRKEGAICENDAYNIAEEEFNGAGWPWRNR